MNRIILAGLTLAIAVTGAAAQQRYDSMLEKAAIAIVAGKIGEIRGGFAYDQLPEFVRPVDWRRAAWSAGTGRQPVALASETSNGPATAF